MREYSAIESELYASFDAILESEALEVDFEKVGAFTDPSAGRPSGFEVQSEWNGVILSPRLDEATPWITELACCWRSVRRKKMPEIHGEFRVRNIYESLLRSAPDLAWEKAPDSEKRLVAEFRTIDDTPRSGAGLLAAIRVQPNVDPLEIWYYDKDLSRYPGHSSDYVRLDLDYREYMKMLSVTKGTFGWQYLFSDVTLSGLSGQVSENLEAMLEVFPVAFPQYDYTPLRERLEARL
ncbi:hypothetical protein [Streptomyces diastatochromogenes]|uniref:Uncharacterized protein n=1 Tax=Streptomyces diastatochromogenes TaxID=42236 RepID=A0A233RY96_STRDA|nr:hypothetical protein [Streptomyces diastatochromogenes]MCZ0990727.1 hypothetical protein [Streptomyces diastatochromogenes]OXY88372.1 hypothetical protein BEK98_42055 [Streptomyces diastatochromogenes]